VIDYQRIESIGKELILPNVVLSLASISFCSTRSFSNCKKATILKKAQPPSLFALSVNNIHFSFMAPVLLFCFLTSGTPDVNITSFSNWIYQKNFVSVQCILLWFQVNSWQRGIASTDLMMLLLLVHYRHHLSQSTFFSLSLLD
jgi:hypothetical protein